MCGRRIPRRIASLKGSSELVEETPAGGNVKQTFAEVVDSIAFRYAEYCITAPLLFLAIMCLLVNDAPAWYYHPFLMERVFFIGETLGVFLMERLTETRAAGCTSSGTG
jgi:hypothetical protein